MKKIQDNCDLWYQQQMSSLFLVQHINNLLERGKKSLFYVVVGCCSKNPNSNENQHCRTRWNLLLKKYRLHWELWAERWLSSECLVEFSCLYLPVLFTYISSGHVRKLFSAWYSVSYKFWFLQNHVLFSSHVSYITAPPFLNSLCTLSWTAGIIYCSCVITD